MDTIKQIDCRYCGEGQMVEKTYSRNIKNGRSVLSVVGLTHWCCASCESVMTSAQQFEANADIIQLAEKKSPGYVSIPMLRAFREKYSLSQREAGRLVGAGDAAFGKYETGSKPSSPTAKLIRVMLAIPDAAKLLAEEEGIVIDAGMDREESISRADEAVAQEVNSPGSWIGGRYRYLHPGRTPGTIDCARPSVNDDRFAVEEKLSSSMHWKKQVIEAARRA